MGEKKYMRGQMYYVSPSEVAVGVEQSGGRPAIIVSNDVGNEYARVVEVVYLTTRDKPKLPTHVVINSCTRPSTALCEQIDSVDKARIGRYINDISMAEMKKLEEALMISLQLNTTLKGTKALDLWRKMMEKEEAAGSEQEDCADVQQSSSVSGEAAAGDSDEQRDTACTEGEYCITCSELCAGSACQYAHTICERDIYRKLYTELIDRLLFSEVQEAREGEV